MGMTESSGEVEGRAEVVEVGRMGKRENEMAPLMLTRSSSYLNHPQSLPRPLLQPHQQEEHSLLLPLSPQLRLPPSSTPTTPFSRHWWLCRGL